VVDVGLRNTSFIFMQEMVMMGDGSMVGPISRPSGRNNVSKPGISTAGEASSAGQGTDSSVVESSMNYIPIENCMGNISWDRERGGVPYNTIVMDV
jgi:hypothetical protein